MARGAEHRGGAGEGARGLSSLRRRTDQTGASPSRLDRRGDDHHHTKTVRKIRRIDHD